jgi:hypothetical protein
MRDRLYDFLLGGAIGSVLTTLIYAALFLFTEWADNDFLECFFLGLGW